MEERHIVAIDLGTSKFALAIAGINGDDIQIKYYREIPANGMRQSYVLNPAQVAAALKPALAEAEKELGIKITQAVVGMPRYHIRQETSPGNIMRANPDEYITAEEINNIKTMAQEEYPLDDATSEEVFGAVAQSFSIGDEFQLVENEVIGMAGDRIEVNFKIFIGKKNHLQNIDRVFNQLKIAVAGKYFTPDTTAHAVLTEEEMENGVALVEFGAGVTSVAVYSGKIMRHYASIPFGGKSVTHDIHLECSTYSEQLAENIKLAYGACMPDKLPSLSEKLLRISTSSAGQYKDLPVKYLSEVITYRTQEIIEAILYEIEKSGFADQLRCGVVITGGSANLTNCRNLITELSGYSVRTGYPLSLFSAAGCQGIYDTEAATSMGMILAAKDDNFTSCIQADDEDSKPSDSGVHIEGVIPGFGGNDGQAGSGSRNDDNGVKDVNVGEQPARKPKKASSITWGRKLKKKFEELTGNLYDQLEEEQNNF